MARCSVFRRLRVTYDRWQVDRVRRAYLGAHDRTSSRTGYGAMVDEMSHGLASWSAAERDLADRRVLDTLFAGAPGVALLRAAFQRWPARAPVWMARTSVAALHFLVGSIGVDPVDPAVNRVARCAFREAGGPALCEHVCRRPTEAYCRAGGFPVKLDPDPGSLACRWTWGAE
jgi:hypothetical protein